MFDYKKAGISLHKELQGKVGVTCKASMKTKKDICLAATAGAAAACESISKNREKAYNLTCKRNTVAVVSDGSHVLGIGNVHAHSALPALEGKCALISHFAGINAVPIAIHTQDAHQIVEIVKQISPTFGAIMLEDIEYPKSELILSRLEKEMRLPVFHNDTQVTAAVTLAALLNALQVAKKNPKKARVVIMGTNTAGSAIAKLLYTAGIQDIVICDSRGALYKKRPNMNAHKNKLVEDVKLRKNSGKLADIVEKADVIIGVSCKGKITTDMIESMAKDPIVFALSRPMPEITPKEAKEAGAKVVATGMFEFPNHIDNTLIFPALIKSAIENEIHDMPEKLFIELAEAVAGTIKSPKEENILPDVMDNATMKAIDKVVAKYAPIKKKVKKAMKKITGKAKTKPKARKIKAKAKTTKKAAPRAVKKVTAKKAKTTKKATKKTKAKTAKKK